MSDKCQSHDQCFARLTDSLEGIRSEVRDGMDEIRDRLRDGQVSFATIRLRQETQDQENAYIRQEIAHLKMAQGAWNWRANLARVLTGLVEKGIIIILAMAYWAHVAGYGRGGP